MRKRFLFVQDFFDENPLSAFYITFNDDIVDFEIGDMKVVDTIDEEGEFIMKGSIELLVSDLPMIISSLQSIVDNPHS